MKTSSTAALTRRRFIVGSTALVGTFAGSVYGVGLFAKNDMSAAAYAYWQRQAPGEMSDEEFIAMCGVLAANPHNTQPWRFALTPGEVQVWADEERHLGSADPQRRMLTMALGCALDNMSIAARQLGYQQLQERLDGDERRIHLTLGERSASGAEPLFDAIFKRQTSRTAFALDDVPPLAMTQTLSRQAEQWGLTLRWYREPRLRAALAQAHRTGVRQWLSEPQRHTDAMKWWRHTREEFETQRDGISIFTSDLPAFFRAAGPTLVSREQLVGDFGREQEIGWVDSIVEQTPLWAVMHGPGDDWQTCVQAGRLLERMYLQATDAGHDVCPLAYAAEDPRNAEMLKAVLNIPEREHVFITCRLGRGRALERSVRRELQTFISRST